MRAMARTISENGIAFIKEHEGFCGRVYTCAGGADTIGYGTTNADFAVTGVKVKAGLTCTKAQADEWLRATIAKKYGPAVNRYDGVYRWTQAEFDALVSFEYNLGKIDQLTANGTRDRATIAAKLLEYVKAGGKANDGLLSRRKDECDMFLGKSKKQQGEAVDLPTLRRGDSGVAVGALQHVLNSESEAYLLVDGKFGPATEDAVKSVQRDRALTVDGICGSKTWEAIIWG